MKILVANRGEIAARIIATIKSLGHVAIAVYTDVDKDAPHVWLADEAVGLGEANGYLNTAALLGAAKQSAADMLHPGYGFLSQSAPFAAACQTAGLVWIGPSPQAMQQLADKAASRQLAQACQIPLPPGGPSVSDARQAEAWANRLGYPVLIKAIAGGGGRGLRAVHRPSDFVAAFAAAQSEAVRYFACPHIAVEKLIAPSRHIEVQALGDRQTLHLLGERECSLQRRYQKVVEESPSGISECLRQKLFAAAHTLLTAAGYQSLGTVEFVVDNQEQFYFLETNTRLQVEHPVTEWVWQTDLVAAQIEVAQGGCLSPGFAVNRGHAIEVRLNAEDPQQQFLPNTGSIALLHWPQLPFVRIDSAIAPGSVVGGDYDNLLAKLVAWGQHRRQAILRLQLALQQMVLLGVKTNQAFLLQVLQSEWFAARQTFTHTLQDWAYRPPTDGLAQLAATQLQSKRHTEHPAPASVSVWQTL